ncbi:MAG: transposase family protein [Nitrosomonas sp.]|nr:transposase family protein [Nitrosomonas sp.]
MRCPVCKSREIHCRGKLVRRFRTVRGKGLYRPSSSAGRMHRCQAVRQVKIQFADEHKRYTRSFERLVWISRHMTIQAVARHLGVSWDLVKGIQKDNLNKRYRLPKWPR